VLGKKSAGALFVQARKAFVYILLFLKQNIQMLGQETLMNAVN